MNQVMERVSVPQFVKFSGKVDASAYVIKKLIESGQIHGEIETTITGRVKHWVYVSLAMKKKILAAEKAVGKKRGRPSKCKKDSQ